MKNLAKTGLVAAVLALAGTAQAELHDRGGGLIYDDVLDITWLQDANYARTTGVDANGRMTWNQAMDWVQNLEYYDPVRDVTWANWRLPRTGPANGSHYIYDFSVDGTTDRGFNTATVHSELAHMFYVTLGNLGYSGTDATYPQPNYGLSNSGPFVNLRPLAYWSGSEYESFLGHAWGFIFLTGTQHAGVKDLEVPYAWPVMDGDVGMPVEPAVEITSPGHATLQSGVISVTAEVTAMQAQRVIFFAAGSVICLDFSAPYSCDWDTTMVPNGVTRIFAIAGDAAGAKLTDTVVVLINN